MLTMSRKKVTLVIDILFGLSFDVHAVEILLGVEASSKSVEVEDKELGGKTIAELDSGISFWPSVGVRSDSSYFGGKSSWGYHYQFDFSIFNINKQVLPGIEDEQDVGTRIKGFSLFAVPVAYYHFNKGELKKWSFKTGVGVGVGYTNMSGDFKITDNNHLELNQTKKVNVSGFGLAIGVYFEASYGKHLVIVQNYAPTVGDADYDYLQHNIAIIYRYAFRFFD